MISRGWVTAAAAAAALVVGVIAATAGAQSTAGAGLCAFRESTDKSGDTATATFHVVQDGCQLSFVSISKFANGNAIFDTATGTFNASNTNQTMSVQLPCGVSSETDLVLGPPTLYPPSDLDLGATAFPEFACPAGGGGGTTDLPDLATTVTSSKTTDVHLGDKVTATVTVANKGKAGAGGVHVLISLSPNAIPKGQAVASRGPGCTGVTVIDCNLGSIGVGTSTTVKLGVSAATGKKLFVGAQAQEIENDLTLHDNANTLTLKLLPKVLAFTVAATPGRVVAGEQLVYIKLSQSAKVTAQVYVAGKAQKITWTRSLSGGTAIVRIPLPATLKHGQHFRLVLRATHAAKKASTTLSLKR